MQLSDFIPELRSVRDWIRFLRKKLYEHRELGTSTPQSLQIAVVMPGIGATKSLRKVTDALRLFQAEVARWNAYARKIDEEPMFLGSREKAWLEADLGLMRLDVTITQVQDAIAEAYPHLAPAAGYHWNAE